MERSWHRHGDVFTLRIRRNEPWVLLVDPDHVKTLFTIPPERTRVAAADANPLLGPMLGPRSVTLLEEPDHMEDRRRILPSFHGEALQRYDEMIVEVSRRHVGEWPRGEPFALWPRMQSISREVLMRAVFTDIDTARMRRLRERLEQVAAWVNDSRRLTAMAAIGPRAIESSRRLRAVLRPAEELILEEVRERREQGRAHEGHDILAMLEAAYDGDDAPMSEDKLRDELVTLLSDGPTATSLAWAFDRLLRDSERLERLRAEAQSGDGDRFADAIVKETLRLCPAVPVAMRRLAAPAQIAGYDLPVGSMVGACIYLMHLRPDVYPEPLDFRPERFLEQPAGTYTWIPFGGGSRRCIAASFSTLEMRRVMQVVASEIALSPASRELATAARSSVSFAPAQGTPVIAQSLA
jgi:cytochrome P450 family 135